MSRAFKILLLSLTLSLAAGVAGAVPNLMNYQGRLTDAAGNPSNGSFSIVFAMYTVGTGGTAQWSETQNVTVTNGIFNVLLGSVTAFPGGLFDNNTLFLGIKVGADAEMTPRQQLGSVPFAQRSLVPGFAMSATGFGGTVNATTTTAVVDSVDIVVPAPGIIQVEASGETYAGHVTGSLTFAHFGVDAARFTIPNSTTGGATQVFYYGALPSQSYDHNIYITRVFPAPAAGSYRFYLNDRFNSGGTGASFFMQFARITATYFPAAFGSTSAPQSALAPAREADPTSTIVSQP